MKIVVGIDEVGRGPIVGPVTVGAFGADKKIKSWLLKNIFQNKLRDSKKLSPVKRVAINRYILQLRKEGKVFFSVSHISNKVIDKIGITKAVVQGINKSLDKIVSSKGYPLNQLIVRLDGLLRAPGEFKNQKTIIKGDEKDVFIACASIMAKVSRDALMCRLAQKYPQKYGKYKFEIHKGYGTFLHRKLIKKYGLSSIHRKTFCKNLIKI